MNDTIFRKVRGRVIPIKAKPVPAATSKKAKEQNGGNPAVLLGTAAAVAAGGGVMSARAEMDGAHYLNAAGKLVKHGFLSSADEALRHAKAFSGKATALRTGSAVAAASLAAAGVNQALKKNKTFRENKEMRFLASGVAGGAAFFAVRTAYYSQMNKHRALVDTLRAAAKAASKRILFRP